jgi:hypothetical protein
VLRNTKFEADSSSYSKINAWWLAELSRLIYRQGADETDDATGPSRKRVLAGGISKRLTSSTRRHRSVDQTHRASALSSRRWFFVNDDLRDWLTNFNAIPTSGQGADLFKGFAEAFDSVRDKVIASLDKNIPSNCPLFIAGHSLGQRSVPGGLLASAGALYTFAHRGWATTTSAKHCRRENLPSGQQRDVDDRALPLRLHHVGELHYINQRAACWFTPMTIRWREIA